jgi:hypothetical protein
MVSPAMAAVCATVAVSIRDRTLVGAQWLSPALEEETKNVEKIQKKLGYFLKMLVKIFWKNVGSYVKISVQLFMKNVGSAFCLENVVTLFIKCCNIL